MRLKITAHRLAMALVFTQGLLTTTVTQAEILIGQTAGFTGPVAAAMKEINEGANLYFDAVNKKGGINGEQLKLISLDDKFDTALVLQNAKDLIEKQNVLALFLSRGTSQTEALLPVLAQNQVALVAPSTGAMSLHDPVNRYVFNVRATYQSEARKGILQLASTSVDKIAVIYRDDGFGKDGLAGADKGFVAAKIKPVFVEKVDKTKADFAAAVAKAVVLNPQAILIIEAPATTARAVQELRAAGVKSQIITLSNCASTGFIKALGPHARGVMVTQVFPGENASALPIINELLELAKARKVDVSPATIEGFAAAKVLVAALQSIKGKPTRASLINALDSMLRVDLGGLTLSFSPANHTGLSFVDMSIIGHDGKFKR